MGAYEGSYTRGGDPEALFDEELLYLFGLWQDGFPLVDADLNSTFFSVMTQLRRVIQNVLGNGALSSAFLIAESASPANNFTITGGDGSNEGMARAFVGGYPCGLKDDVEYSFNPVDARMKRIGSQVSSVVALVLTDTSANYVVNELVGRNLTPDIDNPAVTFPIVANTATTISIGAGDLTVATAKDKFYRVELSTPSGGPRTDEVYLDVFVDEVTATEDTNLVHTDLVPATASALRLVVRQAVKVTEGQALPTDYTDSDGRLHFIFHLATLVRPDGVADVLTAHITDQRTLIGGGAGTLTIRTIDGLVSVVGATELRVTNGKLTNLGGGVAQLDVGGQSDEYLYAHDFENVVGATTDSQIPPDEGGDFETYLQVLGNGAAQETRITFQGHVKPGQTGISQILLPIKGTGDFEINVFVEGTVGNVYSGAVVGAAPGVRTVVTIASGSLTAQPTGEGRYLIAVRALVDAAEYIQVGRPYVRQA